MLELIAFAILAGTFVTSALSIIIARMRRRSIAAAETAQAASYADVLGDALADRKPVKVQRYTLTPGDRLRLESPKASRA